MTTPLAASSVKVGDRVETVVVDGLTRTQIVQYAGASGDFNPLHTDELYATGTAGFDAPLAHGMLTMGLTSRAITDWVGEGRLTSFGVRFVAPVYPGAVLTTRATVEEVERTGDGVVVRIAVATVDEHGATAVTGQAAALLPLQDLAAAGSNA